MDVHGLRSWDLLLHSAVLLPQNLWESWKILIYKGVTDAIISFFPVGLLSLKKQKYCKTFLGANLVHSVKVNKTVNCKENSCATAIIAQTRGGENDKYICKLNVNTESVIPAVHTIIKLIISSFFSPSNTWNSTTFPSTGLWPGIQDAYKPSYSYFTAISSKTKAIVILINTSFCGTSTVLKHHNTGCWKLRIDNLDLLLTRQIWFHLEMGFYHLC